MAGGRVCFLFPVLTPGEMVEGPGAESRAPMPHRAFGIVIEGSEEAFDAFLLVEAKHQFRPRLNQRGASGDDVDTVLLRAPRSKRSILPSVSLYTLR
jgi:hypothetical protein